MSAFRSRLAAVRIPPVFEIHDSLLVFTEDNLHDVAVVQAKQLWCGVMFHADLQRFILALIVDCEAHAVGGGHRVPGDRSAECPGDI